ncbi:hypothetical protein STEG23_012699, partial [Scotinomys teguina]
IVRETPISGVRTFYTDANKQGKAGYKSEDLSKVVQSPYNSVQKSELYAILLVLMDFSEPLNIVTDSQYAERVVLHIETAEFIPDESELTSLFIQLQDILRNRKHPLYITHIRSHTGLAGPLAQDSPKDVFAHKEQEEILRTRRPHSQRGGDEATHKAKKNGQLNSKKHQHFPEFKILDTGGIQVIWYIKYWHRRTQEHPDAIVPQGPRSTRTPSHHKDPGAPRRHHTTRTQEHPDTFTTQATSWDPGTPDAIGLGGPRCNQTILDQENPEVPQTSLDQDIPEAPIIL